MADYVANLYQQLVSKPCNLYRRNLIVSQILQVITDNYLQKLLDSSYDCSEIAEDIAGQCQSLGILTISLTGAHNWEYHRHVGKFNVIEKCVATQFSYHSIAFDFDSNLVIDPRRALSATGHLDTVAYNASDYLAELMNLNQGLDLKYIVE